MIIYNFYTKIYMELLADLCNAGTDTTAMTLSWTFVILCHHQEVQKQLRDEIDSFIKNHDRLPTYEERDDLPFLLSVQKECIRYRPTNHFTIPHESIANCKLVCFSPVVC